MEKINIRHAKMDNIARLTDWVKVKYESSNGLNDGEFIGIIGVNDTDVIIIDPTNVEFLAISEDAERLEFEVGKEYETYPNLTFTIVEKFKEVNITLHKGEN